MTPIELFNWMAAVGVGLMMLGFGIGILGAAVFCCKVLWDMAKS